MKYVLSFLAGFMACVISVCLLVRMLFAAFETIINRLEMIDDVKKLISDIMYRALYGPPSFYRREQCKYAKEWYGRGR